jgi:hypothetical protein
MAVKHLWEYEHAYYCNDENWYDVKCALQYNSWHEFLDDFGWSSIMPDLPKTPLDMDYNMLFRWDCELVKDDNDEPTGDIVLKLYWMQQRKGKFMSTRISISEEDELEIIQWLSPFWDYMKELWIPFSGKEKEQ